MRNAAAIEFGPAGIRVNSIHPGVIDTPMVGEAARRRWAQLLKMQPIPRMGRPEEVAALALFLGWVTIYPWWVRREEAPAPLPAPALAAAPYSRIGVAVEFAGGDDTVLSRAAELARANGAPLVLVHVVEGPGAAYYGAATDDQESRTDRTRMSELVEHLRREGLTAEGVLGYGDPPEELVRIAKAQGMDLLVLEDCLLEKARQPKSKEGEEWRKEYALD